MERRKSDISLEIMQWAVILVTNLLFVGKYFSRAGLNSAYSCIAYGLVFIGAIYLYRHKVTNIITERFARWASIVLLLGIVVCIAGTIYLISPYSIHVDRWSATTFFLDALFQGVYPYGVHTHLCETNFPSPFPLWHYLNIPFWLIGDVGWIQAFSVLVFVGAIYYYFRSWRALLLALLVLYISPAYWWEIMTRSDGLSNALLVCSILLFIERYPIEMRNQWWLIAIIAGCLASTRLSAIIPVALYLFRPWLEANWKVKLGFVGIALLVEFVAFAPYIFWDTETWIFFRRNPFMSQTSPGNIWLLLMMVLVAIYIAYKKQTFQYFVSSTSVFMFAFMFVSSLGVYFMANEPFTFEDPRYDISYFTLSVPYAILALLSKCSMTNETR